MGIRKTGNEWLVTVEAGSDALGVRRRICRTVDSLAEAKRIEAKIRHDVYEQKHVQPSSESVADFCDRFLAQRTQLAPSTRLRYQGMLDSHIRPTLSRVTLARFDVRAAVSWQESQLQSGLSTTTVRKHAVLLASALNWAVACSLIRANPMDLVERPSEGAPPFHVYTQSEQAALLWAATAGEGGSGYHKGRCNGRMFVPIALVLATGMRRGEVLGLRWQDVDLATGRLHLRQGARRSASGGTEYGPMKTKRSRRVVPLPGSLIGILTNLERTDHHHRSGRVFLTGDGDPYTIDGFSSGWRRVRARAAEAMCSGDGILGARFHDLRHTHVTEQLQDGIPVKVIAERIGDSEMTVMRTYAHVLPAMQDSSVAAAELRIGRLLSHRQDE